MGLQKTFNLVLGAIFLVGLIVTGYISYTTELQQARREVIQNAKLIFETATSTKEYTTEEIVPQFQEQLTTTFPRQIVPTYAAHQVFARLSEKLPQFTYREAVISPTNPQNLPAAWEIEIIQELMNNSDLTEVVGQRRLGNSEILYVAQPLQINNESCLECHSSPEAAPAAMVELYGTSNGFNWPINETIGAKIVTVPISIPIQKARESSFIFLTSLFGIFALIFIAINVLLQRLILNPFAEIARITDQASTGNTDVDDFPAVSIDEINTLEKSINRLRRSLEKALQMIGAEDDE